MSYRIFTPLLGCLAILAGQVLAHSSRAAAGPPNVIVIIADDLGWNDVGWHGSQIKTPTLDKLASGGIDLARHYVYPTCSPTRCGIFTGRNPSRFDIHGPIGGRSELALPLETMNLARLFKKQGYATAHVGKWHLGLRPEVGPRKYGFDQSYGYLHGQVDPYVHDYKNGDRTWHRNEEFLDETGHVTDLLADEAVRFVSAQREQPFFLWLAFSVPHHPLAEPEQWLKPYAQDIADPSRRLFAASVTHMDAAIGRLLEALEKVGQIDNTLLLFTSDNGGQTGWSSKTEYAGRFQPQPVLGNNQPLRDWKGSLYEGGVRVPALVSWRGKLAPTKLQRPVTLLDWLPTLAAVAGAETSPEWKLEGRNVWPLFPLAIDPRETTPLPGSISTPTVSLARLHWNIGKTRGFLSEDWKLIVKGDRPDEQELYHLEVDPEEKQNLATTEIARREKLVAMLEDQLNGDPK